MTHEEMEGQFKSLGELFDVKIRSSEERICANLVRLEAEFIGMKQLVDRHGEWHSSINDKIISFTVKSALILFVFVVIIVFAAGVNENVISNVLAKVIG